MAGAAVAGWNARRWRRRTTFGGCSRSLTRIKQGAKGGDQERQANARFQQEVTAPLLTLLLSKYLSWCWELFINPGLQVTPYLPPFGWGCPSTPHLLFHSCCGLRAVPWVYVDSFHSASKNKHHSVWLEPSGSLFPLQPLMPLPGLINFKVSSFLPRIVPLWILVCLIWR